MIKPSAQFGVCFACFLGFGLCATTPVRAQAVRTPTPGPAAGGAARSLGAGGTTTRQYYGNGTVGEAMISSDPETRRLIVITDEETGKYVSQVVTNLDRPNPQVLIKVVFLEVTHNDSLDIGIEGGYKKNFLG